MNKVLKTTAALAIVVSSSQAAPFWELEVDGANSGTNLTGVWFSYDDANETKDGKGGCAKVNFPPADPTCSNDVVSGPWKATPALVYDYDPARGCGVIGANNSGANMYPFAGVGFNLLEAQCLGDNKFASATAAPNKVPGRDGGIKVWYKLEGDGEFFLQMSTADVSDSPEDKDKGITAYNEFARTMVKGDFLAEGREFMFDQFKQESGWGTQLDDVSEALAAVVGFKFKGDFRPSNVTGKDVNTERAAATLTITKLEWIGTPGTPTLKTNGGALVGMTQAGRVLSFTGISPNSTVEVINLHGALVAREAMGPVSNPSINLSSLPSGVYMVKVKGTSQSFTQKVLLLK